MFYQKKLLNGSGIIVQDCGKYKFDLSEFKKGRIDIDEFRKRRNDNFNIKNEKEMRKVGEKVGYDFLKNQKVYADGFLTLKYLQEKLGIKILFLSASPRPFIEGLLSVFLKEFKFDYKNLYIIGTELLFYNNSIAEKIWIFGEMKKFLAQLMLQKKAELLIGFGDDAENDCFLPFMKNSYLIDKRNGKEYWQTIIEWKKNETLLK